jgi:DNA-binding beta-propeller fold protein YncE
MSNDGLLYICDRGNDRLQVFRPDGTFVKEAFVAPNTLAFGSVGAIAFSPDREQQFMYVGDGPNHKVWILRRSDLQVLGSFGRSGRGGGQFLVVHALAVDSRGNLYVGETINNNRVQKFSYTGLKPAPAN